MIPILRGNLAKVARQNWERLSKASKDLKDKDAKDEVSGAGDRFVLMVTGAATGRTRWEASGFPTQPRTSVWIQTKFSLEFVWKTKVALMKFFRYVMLCNVTRVMYVIIMVWLYQNATPNFFGSMSLIMYVVEPKVLKYSLCGSKVLVFSLWYKVQYVIQHSNSYF